MRSPHIVITVCAALSTACVGFNGFDCSETDDRQAAIDTSGATEIRVIAQAGSLTITGHRDRDEVRASGTACATSRARLDDVELLTRRDGDVVVIETVTARGRLDLNLEVPDTLPLVVEDSSGSVRISSGSRRSQETSGSRTGPVLWTSSRSGAPSRSRRMAPAPSR